MPWKRERYPENWPEIEQACKERAGWVCEGCGVAHRATRIGKKRKRPYIVILAAAHLNHDPTDNREENLRAYCQDCHLKHDRYQHGTNAQRTKCRNRYIDARAAGQLELFGEESA